MTIPTEAEIIAPLEREAGAEVDMAATIAKRHDHEGAWHGPVVAACGHMLAINTVDSLIRGMCEAALGGPLAARTAAQVHERGRGDGLGVGR